MKLFNHLHLRGARCFLAALASTLLVANAGATWSVVVVDTRTGEVCVASATCIQNFVLKPQLALIQVGRGAAAAQSTLDPTTQNRMFIWQSMRDNARPLDILASLQAMDPDHRRRQYGIVTMDAQPATFTGTLAGVAKYGITGIVDDLRYAIQGNVLSGIGVVYGAEEALLSTPGDLSQKVMAAMQAARARGGDGRCSCNISNPTGCGPTPPSFTFSAYTAFIVLARMGDQDGACKPGVGCANGDYFLDLAAVSGPAGQEPIVLLQQRYDTWRTTRSGIVDHLQSTVVPGLDHLPADGLSTTQVDVFLADIDGLPITQLPDEVRVENTGASKLGLVGPVSDLGGGHHAFIVTAGTTPGVGTWSITARYGGKLVRLWPDLALTFEP